MEHYTAVGVIHLIFPDELEMEDRTDHYEQAMPHSTTWISDGPVCTGLWQRLPTQSKDAHKKICAFRHSSLIADVA